MTYFRLSCSKMVDTSSERNISSISNAKNFTHINGIISFIFLEKSILIKATTYSFQLFQIFYVKSTGTSNIVNSIIELMPLLNINWQTVRVLSC